MIQVRLLLGVVFLFALGACSQESSETVELGSEVVEASDLSVEELGRETEEMFALYQTLEASAEEVMGAEKFDKHFEPYAVENKRVLALHGPVFRRELVKKLEQAVEVRITEHSDREDFILPDLSIPEKVPSYEYRSVTLDSSQRLALLEGVRSLSGVTDEGTACPFVAHHRIDLIGEDGDSSRIEVCFKCGEFYWDEVNLFAPQGLIEVIRDAVMKAGLKPVRDWQALAIERAKED
ncbi:hypothetical protein [Haloferula sp.]|uniref:hypothetical protein n=1 Tax=Haloferula sp. TaxID=2497595 RepID=UPI003C710301